MTAYSEVVQVLRDPLFIPALVGAQEAAEILETQSAVDDRRTQMKSVAGEIMVRLDRALPGLLSRAMMNFDGNREYDFLTEILKPWCIAVAACGVGDRADARCGTLAESIFAASAFPYNPDLQKAARSAVAELNERLGPENVLAVQTFVALSASLPVFLGTAWALLLSHPDQWRLLQQDPTLAPLVIEECLRFSGLPRIQFRQAACDVVLGGMEIRQKQNVLLMIQLANKDPAVFPDPNSFDITRTNNPHLSFGRGGHSCVGAHIVRSIGRALTVHLTSVIKTAELRETPRWKGVAMRFLET
ncbi:MAG: cytochrome P450, partial [Acidobacteriota bacterium]|nr:cytochrome P450 [Acidobacteriota bacterium]